MRKNFVSKLLTGSMILMVVSSAMTLSATASSTDTPWSYYLAAGSDNFKTDFRHKSNSTSVYMKCNSTNGAYNACVFGAPNEMGQCAWDMSNGYHYRFNSGQARFMFNIVYETWGSGYPQRNAAVFSLTHSGNIYASGVWSPDSVPEAGVLPPTDYIRN